MKKIKIAMTVTSLGLNGISSVIMNYSRMLNKDKYEITIFAGKNIDSNYMKECEKLGIRIVELPRRKPTTIQYYFQMFKKMKKNYYDIIHVHGNSSAMAIELFISKLKKVKVRIAHCHNSNCSNPFVNNLFKILFKRLYHFGLACSELAGEWVFESKFLVLPNGFEIDRYIYNENNRTEIRKKYNITDDDFVIGHTGRFNDQKNQIFLVELLALMTKLNNNYKLLFVGDGPNYNDVKKQVQQLGLEKKVIFIGETIDVYKYYSAMDMFAFPSNYEGLGISLLEAQLNGLTCLASKFVPTAAAITDNVTFLEINDKNIWKNKIETQKKYRNIINLNDNRIQQYNIKNNINVLEQVYEKEIKKRG